MRTKIFLSAVSTQFRDCRDALASDLRAVGAEVVVQEDFQQHGRTLLEKLQAYIAGCDRVIALVGDACGWEPDLDSLPPGTPRRSYTQWEYHFALGQRLLGEPVRRKDVSVYFAAPDFLSQRPVAESNEVKQLQREFIRAVKRTGQDRSPFSSLHELRALVLRDGFRFPERARVPHNLPYASLGDIFKGRDQFLADLRQTFQGAVDTRATAAVRGSVVHGLGGVGKTRVAVEYAWRHLDAYSAILFVSADTPEILHRDLAALTAPLILGLPEQSDFNEVIRVTAVVHWLQEHSGWLLVLDNADTPEAAAAAEQLLARLSGGHVLITSRLTQWSAAVPLLELDVLDQPSALEFLLDRTHARRSATPEDESDAAQIAKELDGLPIALEQAGAYIAHRRCSFAMYLAQWRASITAVSAWFDRRLMNYPRSLAVTWDTTLQQLNPPDAALLYLLAWLSPDRIPTSLLEGDRAPELWLSAQKLLGVEASDAGGGKSAVADTLSALANLSMIRLTDDGSAVVVHRVVQEMLRERTPEKRRKDWVDLAVNLLDSAAIGDPADVRNWPQWELLYPHVLVATTAADRAGIAAPTGRLMNEAAVYLASKALYAEAEPLARRSLAIEEAHLGMDHPEIAVRLNNLARLLDETNRREEAEPILRRAVEISEAAYGPTHENVTTNLNNLASLLRATGRLDEAEEITRRVLRIDEGLFGPHHQIVAVDLNNLAFVLQALRKFEEAEPLMQRSLRVNEECFGPDHPNVAVSLGNLGALLFKTGRTDQALPIMRRALAIDEKHFDAHHPKIAMRLNNLAQVVAEAGEHSEAEALYRRALRICKRSLGPDHPSTNSVRANLSLLAR